MAPVARHISLSLNSSELVVGAEVALAVLLMAAVAADRAARRSTLSVYFNFGEGVIAQEQILETVQTGFNYREIATDIGQTVAAACRLMYYVYNDGKF